MNSSGKPPMGPVVTALAVAEGRHLLASRMFWSGLLIALLGTGVFIRSALAEESPTWDDDAWTMGVGFFLAAIFVMVAVNRAALRDRREHVVEQLNALPAPRSARVAGLFAGALWPAAVTSVLVAGGVLFAATSLEVPAVSAFFVVHNAVLVLMLGAVGLVLATWMPSPFVAPVVAFALFLIAPGETPAAWHVIWPFATLETWGLIAWHIGYLLALALLFAAIASGRPDWRRGQTIVALMSGVAVVIALTVLISGVCPPRGPCLL